MAGVLFLWHGSGKVCFYVSQAFETMMVFPLSKAFLFFVFSDFEDKKKGIRFSGGSHFQLFLLVFRPGRAPDQ